MGEVTRLPSLAAILGCKTSMLPMTYLGLPLGATFKDKKVWDGVHTDAEKVNWVEREVFIQRW